jgi:hypothetical protein
MTTKLESGGDYASHTLPVLEARRSNRVVLQVLLQLSARLPGGERICIEVMTVVVNAHGGLIDMGMEMEPGQRIMLSKFPSPEVVTATVLRIEKTEDDRSLTAFEFEFPVHDFWPIAFPSDDLSWIG